MDIERWRFALSTNGDRQENLDQPPPLEHIVESIRDTMTVLCCHADPISKTDIKRVAYCIGVENKLFDLFFNSRTGYRAWYYRSPFDGSRVNSSVMELLSPDLMKSPQTQECKLPTDFISESLRSPSSKVWLTECGKEVCLSCTGCKGEWTSATTGDPKIELLNDRWEENPHYKAKWGRTAPYLTKLRILGAFLDDRLKEFIPADKHFRAEEIHEFGWS